MKTTTQLDQLAEKIGEAIRNYHKACEENLLELGHPVTVQDVYNEDERGLTLNIVSDTRVLIGTFDQIRMRNDHIEVHCLSWDYVPADEWLYLSALGEAADYVLEAAQWFDDVKLKVVDGDVWSGTANEVYSFCNPDIFLYFIHSDGRIDRVDWYTSIDDFAGVNGVFAVEEKCYEKAILQIEQHNATIQ